MSRILGLMCLACLFEAGCFQDSTQQHSAFLPLNYKSTFRTVRDCRLVLQHANQYQLVLADPLIAADPYTARSYPMPTGSVVVAEQHGNDPSCQNLLGFYLMAKEKPGYDPAAGDWHWQELDANQRISQDGHLTACSSCHAQPPCNDFLCSPP
jgi:hypothetical protein